MSVSDSPTHPPGADGPAARLDALTRTLLRLEEAGPGHASVAAAGWRSVAAGHEPAARLATAAAEVLDAVATGGRGLTPTLCEALLAAADTAAEVLGVSAGPADTDAAIARLAEHPVGGRTADVEEWPPPARGLAPDLVAQFVAEAQDSLQEAEAALLDIEHRPDHPDAVNALFRAVHSIKGTADYVGLVQIKTLTHRMEDVLAQARAGRLDLSDGGAELVFQGVDHLRAMLRCLTADGEQDRDLSGFVAALAGVCAPATVSDPVAGDVGGNSREAAAFRAAAEQHLDGLTDGFRSVAAGDASAPVLGLLRRCAGSLKTAAGFVGRSEVEAPAAQLLALLDRLEAARGKLASVFGPPSSLPAVPEPRVQPTNSQPPAAAPRPADSAPKADATPKGPAAGPRTMRVDQRKLDEYVNLAGELVIARNSLTHAFRQFQAGPGPSRPLKDAVDKLDRIVGAVQTNAMGMRMVPAGTVFQRFPRLIRDVSRALDKQIELDLVGEDTELDKQVAEALSDPLVHLVRNSADHGIEAPAARRAAGKPETGRITLTAGREGNAILIGIRDDGGGISVERLKQKAVASGVLTPEKAAGLSRAEALDLIFAPGLSTAEVVSDLSGRGVGMDVVRSNIAAIGGTVSVSSEDGRGTRIRLTLPLTLAVTTAVLVEAGGNTYGVPVSAVRETVRVGPETVRRLRGVTAIALRGEVIPVRPLTGLLGGSTGAWTPDARTPVVVLSAGGSRLGVAVDTLRGQQEVVLKPVPAQIGQVEGVGGATITGDGAVVLVLDPAGLLRTAAKCEP